jgi:hypothetical protein
MLVGSLAVYALGVPWLKWVTGMSWPQALAVGCYPFLIGDALKIAAAVPIVRAVRPLMHGVPFRARPILKVRGIGGNACEAGKIDQRLCLDERVMNSIEIENLTHCFAHGGRGVHVISPCHCQGAVRGAGRAQRFGQIHLAAPFQRPAAASGRQHTRGRCGRRR